MSSGLRDHSAKEKRRALLSNGRGPAAKRSAVLCLLVLLTSSASAQELIPLPDFTEYELKDSTFPAVRAASWELIDLGVLVLGMALASYLAVVRRSRAGLLVVAVVSLAYLGFWRKGCICPIGATQNVTLALFDPTYLIPATAVAFFVLPLVFTLFFGRTFCAGVCPLGAIQELVAVRPIRIPVWLEHALGLLAYVYLGAAVLFAATGTAFVICRYDPFVGLFRRGAGLNMLVLGGCFLAVGVFVGRPYCRFLCPYGVVLGWLAKVSRWHLTIPPEECVQCRLCEDVCPYGAIRETTVDQLPEQRVQGRRRLGMLLVALPVLVIFGIYLGGWLKTPLSQLHPTVRLADRVMLEEIDYFEDATDASDAFRKSGQTVEQLITEAKALTDRFGTAGMWFGGWVGLVIGVKLIHLSIRRRRVGYEPDRSNCVSCGRCFWYCPEEQARLGLVEGIESPSPRSQEP